MNINYCKTCTFSMDKERGIPHCGYPCLCCCRSSLFPLALKDCASYYTIQPKPPEMTYTEFARMVKRTND